MVPASNAGGSSLHIRTVFLPTTVNDKYHGAVGDCNFNECTNTIPARGTLRGNTQTHRVMRIWERCREAASESLIYDSILDVIGYMRMYK